MIMVRINVVKAGYIYRKLKHLFESNPDENVRLLGLELLDELVDVMAGEDEKS